MMSGRSSGASALIFFGAAWASIVSAQTAPRTVPPIDFEREIRPVLSENCFQCHGPDAKSRMAGLRLDLKEGAFEVRKNGAPIVPGHAEKSLLYQRISAPEAARHMPPAYSHKNLTEAQVALLKRWIEQGAPWQEHWAFRAPVKPKLPAVRNAAWVRTPIDRFILARLEAKGLTPAPEADRRTLIRRVALDVTGLPPTPAELETYIKDTAAGAYERMVDRYLASPHYGEHRAHYWLDAARYGDTHGIHFDNYREIWPYRDWVIQAYNRNLSFDQFTIDQLAGDLLPNPTLDQRIATGFERCGVTTNEAGIIEDEYKEIYAKDRAETTAAVWLGITVGCATCHDHKFDPISQKDFYALGAFFRNTTQPVMDGNMPDSAPVIVVPRPEDRPKWEKLSARLTAVQSAMADAIKGADQPFAEWLGHRSKAVVAHPFDAKGEAYAADVAALAKADGPVRTGDSNIAGRPAVYFVKDEGVSIKNAPQLDAGKPFTISVDFFYPKVEQTYVIAARQNPKEKNRGWMLQVAARVIDMRMSDGTNTLTIRAGNLAQLKPGTWNHAIVSYDGSRRQAGLKLYMNGRATPPQGRKAEQLTGDIGVDVPLVLGKSLAEGAIADFRILNHAVNEHEAQFLSQWLGIQAALAKDNSQLNESDRKALLTWFTFREYEPYRRLMDEQKKLNVDAKAIAARGAVTLVMQERTDSKPEAYVLYRGMYDQKRQRVEAATPAILPPMAADLPRNRLGFAEWLFTADNPLTARVTVNRMWQEIFGEAIVRTAGDFGSQGDPPSHPQLLDWLAVDFREHGWDMKAFYRQVLLSAVYRQSEHATPEKLAKDPENRLLSHSPRFRLDAEVLRDYALASSGLLSAQIGGPSVRPYQPSNVWEAVAMPSSDTRVYHRDSGDALYRRSVYTFWKRAAPPASMEIFNAPTRESCTIRRERTNTPLQALVTMDDPQFVEAARVLAERSMEDAAGLDGQLDFIATRLLARPLSAKERLIAHRSYDWFRGYYQAHEQEAGELLAEGERKADPALPRADYAAMAMLVNQLMNLDEVLNK